jgi:hypothetical protein
MNLHNQFPSNIYVISTSATGDEAPLRGNFFAITCTIAGDVTVTGGGVHVYVDIDSATGSEVVKYIDPNTGEAYENVAAASGDSPGFYEKVGSEASVLSMIAGQTIYGRFDSVMSDQTFTGFAYAG